MTIRKPNRTPARHRKTRDGSRTRYPRLVRRVRYTARHTALKEQQS